MVRLNSSTSCFRTWPASMSSESWVRAGWSIRGHDAGAGSGLPGVRASVQSVHSRYERWLADRGVGGREVTIHLRVRRFFCIEPSCPRRILAEQVSGSTERYRRCGPGLRAASPAFSRYWVRCIAWSESTSAASSGDVQSSTHRRAFCRAFKSVRLLESRLARDGGRREGPPASWRSS